MKSCRFCLTDKPDEAFKASDTCTSCIPLETSLRTLVNRKGKLTFEEFVSSQQNILSRVGRHSGYIYSCGEII